VSIRSYQKYWQIFPQENNLDSNRDNRLKKSRNIKKIFRAQPTIEGAGVHLKRVFGHAEAPTFDPFLLLDDFHSDNPKDYAAGFPWHPHRGIETVTYMIHGSVEHRDSLGNKGMIQPGDMQWMTAGSGIIHQEMPKGYDGLMRGLQLWVNLPSNHKMRAPRYREIQSENIPKHQLNSGTTVKVICGQYKGLTGPVKDIIQDPEYLDISIPYNEVFVHSVKKEHTLFAYILEGSGIFEPGSEQRISAEHLVLFGDRNVVTIQAAEKGLRFLLISGKPIGEPVAWYGPIVMNTEDELRLALEEYRNSTFIKN
jgi:redox-sensitive bicupin YhaK (pirin superfamily)